LSPDDAPPAPPPAPTFTEMSKGYCADWVYPGGGRNVGYDTVSKDAAGCLKRCQTVNPTGTHFYTKGTKCGCCQSTSGQVTVYASSSYTQYKIDKPLAAGSAPFTLRSPLGYCSDWYYPASGVSGGRNGFAYDTKSSDPAGCMKRCKAITSGAISFFVKGMKCGCCSGTSGRTDIHSSKGYMAFTINKNPDPTPAPAGSPTQATPAPSCVETLSGTKGAGYRGCQTKTRSGLTCQAWASQSPHGHSRTKAHYPSAGLDSNFCRNPDSEDTIWCYTTSSSKRWEYCDPKGGGS